jgi:stage II sporulation protein D
MRFFLRSIARILIVSLIGPATLGTIKMAQETRDRTLGTKSQTTATTPSWPAEQSSVVQQTEGAPQLARLSSEPVMRIALATDVRSANVSTAAHLINASEVTPIQLETSRVHVEVRALSPRPPAAEPPHIIELARSVTREDADRLIESVKTKIGEEARAISDGANQWRVVISKSSREAVEVTSAKLEEAGFDILNSSDDANTISATKAPPAAPPAATTNQSSSKGIRLTTRASMPTREVVAFASGAAPMLRSSAPVVFASTDEAHAPVRFSEKPYRGRIEVFANTHGALTVVNVIGLEDYVRGVVPNELSPGGYPAIEALKAQAIAARTYALRNRGQFASEGYDLLPTTRSQVYRGLSSEHPLSSRAVDETRGLIATYNGEPINALYTSTCGGRTEDSENIFNTAVPYLRGRECAAEGKAALAPFIIKSSRELFDIKDEKDLVFARDVALLAVNGLPIPSDHISSSWLAAHVSESEARDWITAASRLAHTAQFSAPQDVTKPPAFSTALVAAVLGEKRADTLLNNADVEYLLAFRDAENIPAENRADVALLLRDGYLSLFADATLRPREPISHARALHAIARVLEARGLLALQKGTTRPANSGAMILRSNKGKDMPLSVGHEAFLFREMGDGLYQVKTVALVGGEPVTFHLSPQGAVDYLEVKPAPNGASAERFSPFTNWIDELTVGVVQARLGRSVHGIGAITNLRIAARGSSRRVTDLEVVGTQGTGHVRGGRIRSALGLREQLFVIDRVYDPAGRVTAFIFTGRGWGHGVGMCQVGAYGLAKQGFTSEQILKAYYTGIELTKMY